MLSGYVYVDVAGRDIGSYVNEAKQVVSRGLRLPPGYTIAWSGQYEAMARVRQRLTLVLPLTLFLVMLLLYLNTRSAVKTAIIILAVPFSAVGAIWLLYLLGYNMSIGVWVGLIALMGVDAETAVFMLLYLDIAYHRAEREGRLRSLPRSAGGHPGRRGQAHPSEVHDGGGHVPRPGAHHVVHRRRRRRHEAHCRPHDRRHLHIVPVGVGGLSRNLRGMEMAFRSKTPAVALLILAFGMPLEAAEPLVFQVRHRHLRRGAEGTLRVGDDGITFAEAGRSKAHSRQWRFEEIEQLTLSPDTLRILTYEDQHMRFGRDREFVFDALPKDLAARLYPFFSRLLDQRFVAALAVDPGQPAVGNPGPAAPPRRQCARQHSGRRGARRFSQRIARASRAPGASTTSIW